MEFFSTVRRENNLILIIFSFRSANNLTSGCIFITQQDFSFLNEAAIGTLDNGGCGLVGMTKEDKTFSWALCGSVSE